MNESALLSGLKILDLGRLLPSCYGTMLLGDMGADIIKVEEPGKGDYLRWMPPMVNGENIPFLISNRNKRSLTLDLRRQKGRKIFYSLLKDYDIVVESFRPSVKQKLGIDYETLKGINPRVILLSLTGFGQTSPMREKPGHDLNYAAVAGCLAPLGSDGPEPELPTLPEADMSGGMFLALAALAAHISRLSTGKGQAIDVPITDCLASLNMVNLGNAFAERTGNPILQIHGQVPSYNIYRTKDNRYITLGLVEEKFWKNFCKTISRTDLKDKQYETGSAGEAVRKEIQTVIGKRDLSEWLEIFEDSDFCYGPVYWPEEIFESGQFIGQSLSAPLNGSQAKGMFQLKFPVKFSESNPEIRTAAPGLGQHSLEILSGLGYSSNEIAEFQRKKIT